MNSYVVAVPTYNRVNEVINKTLETLKNGKISKKHIYLFVANKEQEKLYEDAVPKTMYHKIVVGEKGIRNQRKFISKYFPVNRYIVSIDDDVEELLMMHNAEKLVKINNSHAPLYIKIYTIDSQVAKQIKLMLSCKRV